MDCRTARQLLDCLHTGTAGSVELVHLTNDAADASHEELSDHLDHCPACRHVLEEREHFDRRLFSMLMSSPVPPGLEERLLSAIETELPQSEPLPATAPPFASADSPRAPGRKKKARLWTTLVTTACLLILGTVWWTRPRTDELLSYHGAGRLLAEHFLKADDAWADLEQFDGNFDLGTYQVDLGLFELSPAHGIDLGGGRSQDAAVFEFGLKNWKGIITVLPSQHFTGLPDVGTSNVMAGHTVLQWRSSDGKLTYLCFVHRGSAAALAQELFGLLT